MQPWVYIVLLGVAAIAYSLMMPRRSKQENLEQRALKETEAALEMYVADIERENEEIINLVGSIKQQSQATQGALQEQLVELKAQLAEQQRISAQLESRLTAGESGLLQLAMLSKGQPDAVNERIVPEKTENSIAEEQTEPAKPVNSIKLRYPKLFELNEQGKSIDAISKIVGLQRGEVQLILQLSKQEESL
ncbi:hypothetical protein [Paenibacillus sp. sgz500958]|uniref:hypothetical protein n=1 Tax=Paenibacillus sp. sgz500958 TaxID=3242475 RepID=UPI0036D433FF